MISRTFVSIATACFGGVVILSGFYRYFVEANGGENGLWFGLVMGGIALIAAMLQRTRSFLAGDCLAVVTSLLVGGWFCYENFAKGKHELRMYLMILAAIAELATLPAYYASKWKERNSKDLDTESSGSSHDQD